MSHFFTEDEMMRDLLILGFVILLMYISTSITPVTFDSVVSGQVFVNMFSFLQGKADISAIQHFLLSLQNILGVLAIVFLSGIFWTMLKGHEIHHAEHKKYEAIPVEEVETNGRLVQWKIVLEHVSSTNPAEWKLAILEADNMLDEILEEHGYVGETLAEKLKAISPAKMASYNEVWEAHKLRNQIAHGGAIDMELNQKTAKDAVAQFGNAFKELGVL